MDFDWDEPKAHRFLHVVTGDHIDLMGHANNCEYLKWMEQAAWDHCDSIGMGFKNWLKLGYGWVVHHTELDYLAPAFEGDELIVATWVSHSDEKLSITRQYQILRKHDGKTLLRGSNRWICVSLKTQKPCRMPEEFKQSFKAIGYSHPEPAAS